MSVTQKSIAEAVGIDVSSVNKILNHVPGPSFKEETIKLVFKTAREMGYNFKRVSKHSLLRENEALRTKVQGLESELAVLKSSA